jgi:hypothetical protein
MSQVRITALLDSTLHERVQALRIQGKRILSFGEALRMVVAEGLPLAERQAVAPGFPPLGAPDDASPAPAPREAA